MTTKAKVPGSVTTAATLLREVGRLHARAQRALMSSDESRNSSCTILTELGRSSSTTLSALARRLRLDKGWTSRAVEQLVREGYVVRKHDMADRRAIQLSISPKGDRELRRMNRLLDEQMQRVIDAIPIDARKHLDVALHHLLASYEHELVAFNAMESATPDSA